MDLTIIIISFNTKSITQKCIETIITSLKESPLKVEILVVDNGSEDGSLEMLQTYKNTQALTFTIIQSKENLGFVKANNLAAKQALSEMLFFLNSDIEVIDKAIDEIYTYFKAQKTFQFVGGKLFNKDMTPQASAGPTYNLGNIFLFLFLRGDYLHITRFSPNDITEVAWVSGACFITLKSTFQSLGGFDDGIFMYMEEIDLFYRAQKNNMKIGFYPKSKFIHLGSASSEGRTQPILQVYKGYLYFYKKHYSKNSLFILKCMLQLKAILSLAAGVAFKIVGRQKRSEYLLKTYAEAYQIAKNY